MISNSIQVDPLTPTVGAEVRGVDLTRPLDEAALAAVRSALIAHGVIFFRDQAFDLDKLQAFARYFGAPHIHPTEKCVAGHPGITRIHVDAESKTYAGRMWHSDVTCDPEPPMGSILHLHEVPPQGGDTLFASMYAAYDVLSEPLKRFLCGLSALHEARHNLGGYFGAKEAQTRDGAFPEAVHPVVCTHPESGKKLLFVNPAFTTRIVDLEPEESAAVLEMLYRHIAQPRFQCRFRWRKHSVAFWDNRCVQHTAMRDYHPHTRSGHRATIAGVPPS